MKISCLGPAESYSCLAAKKIRPGAECVCCKSFADVVEKLKSGETDYAVLPIVNCITGSIVKNLDLIADTDGIMGVECHKMHVDHRLVTKGRIPFERIERVCSHIQALGQCEKFILTHFPNARLEVTHSTAESLSLLDGHTAGIVGAHVAQAAGDGLVFSKENIADESNNATRFMLLEKRTALPDKSNYIFFTAVCRHRPGTLASFLTIFSKLGLNLSQISSRPLQRSVGPYRFFMEIQADIGSPDVRNALEEAKQQGAQFRLIGVYD